MDCTGLCALPAPGIDAHRTPTCDTPATPMTSNLQCRVFLGRSRAAGCLPKHVSCRALVVGRGVGGVGCCQRGGVSRGDGVSSASSEPGNLEAGTEAPRPSHPMTHDGPIWRGPPRGRSPGTTQVDRGRARRPLKACRKHPRPYPPPRPPPPPTPTYEPTAGGHARVAQLLWVSGSVRAVALRWGSQRCTPTHVPGGSLQGERAEPGPLQECGAGGCGGAAELLGGAGPAVRQAVHRSHGHRGPAQGERTLRTRPACPARSSRVGRSTVL